MSIDTQKLRDGPYLRDGQETKRIMIEAADTIDAQAAEIKRLRMALERLGDNFRAARNEASARFIKSGNMYHSGRQVAYDQAAADVRAALQGEPK